MPSEYFQLRHEVSSLRHKMLCHEYLYNNLKEDFDHISRFSPNFFGFFQSELHYSIILHIGRLFEKRNDTFSFEKVIRNKFNKNEEKLKKHIKLLDKLKIELADILKWRKNVVAHKNYEVVFNKTIMPKMNNIKLKEAVDKITDFFHKIEEDYIENKEKIGFDYKDNEMTFSIKNLIKKVKRANAYDKLITCGMYWLNDENKILNLDKNKLKKLIANHALNLDW
jgi:hypothetical protein